MKTARFTSSVFLLSILAILAGCKAGETASNNASAPSASSSAANSNQSAQANANGSASPTKEAAESTIPTPSAPAALIGTYESREVEDKGVVTVLSQLKTKLMFSSDGRYSRMSEVKGTPYHADSGTFRLNPPDNLVLNIQETGIGAKRKILSVPLFKTHKFSLSADGNELRLTSEKGSVGIFKRVVKPTKTP